MSSIDKIKIAIVKQVLEKGIFDAKKMMKIDAKRGILTVSDYRTLIIPTFEYAVLHDAVEKLAGYAGPAILRAQGEESGRISFKKSWLRSFESFHIKSDIPTILSLFPVLYSPLGWGRIITTGINKETGEGTLIIENCFEADAILEIKGKNDKPQCYFVTGYLKGLFSEITGKKIRVTETKCKVVGTEHCEFQIDLVEEKS